MSAKDTAAKLQQDFDQLMGNYRRMTQMLLDGLAPGVPQEQRNALRKLFTPNAMNSENSSPRSSKRRLERRSPTWNVEVLQWSDGTSTINLFVSGVPQQSHGPIEGRLSLPEAFAWLAINLRSN